MNWRGRFASFAVLSAWLAAPAAAHRVDEYLQATRLSIDTERVDLEIDLTAGSALAYQVFGWIDTNRNGEISDAEGQVYARQVLDCSRTEGRWLARAHQFGRNQFPSISRHESGSWDHPPAGNRKGSGRKRRTSSDFILEHAPDGVERLPRQRARPGESPYSAGRSAARSRATRAHVGLPGGWRCNARAFVHPACRIGDGCCVFVFATWALTNARYAAAVTVTPQEMRPTQLRANPRSHEQIRFSDSGNSPFILRDRGGHVSHSRSSSNPEPARADRCLDPIDLR